MDIKNKHASGKDDKATAKYKAILKLTQDIYGKQDIKTEDDADGLISDAVFVGLPGNISFFTDMGNLSGFEGKQKAAIDVAVALGDASTRTRFLRANYDYNRLQKIGDLTGKAPPAERFSDNVKFLDKDTIYSFTIYFEPNQHEFPEARYGDDFQRALDQASLFGNAIVVVRGHADPDEPGQRRRGGRAWQRLRSQGHEETRGQDRKGKPGGPVLNKELRTGVTNLLELSKRHEQVRKSVVNYAGSKGYSLDKSQMRFVGVGIVEPVVVRVPRPETDTEMSQEPRASSSASSR